MSRIFDALQRSGTEQSGIEYPDMVSVATEVFEAPNRQTSSESSDPNVADQALAFPLPLVQTPLRETIAQGEGKEENTPQEFPSLEVSVQASSRLVYFSEPDGLAAEKFRFLGVRLRQLQQNRSLKKVLVTSTIPEEGKSLVSANLAGALTRRKQRVLLVEGDMRRPNLAQQFGLGRLAGLSEWLQSGLRTVSNIYHLRGPGFWLMPAGDPPVNPIELMQSGRLSELMAQVTPMFDWIIVDSPPLLPLADATVWARFTEGTLLVAREGKTEKAQLQKGLEVLKKSELLGVVLNGVTNPNHKNYYQRYAPQEAK
ncbi:putative Non-specific protein-tyrosine kinase [Candidatus Sulfotelmatobacter kueseliae]|uniref:Putative Non-specific protein-tyrosine kinase n=1 Tax=Candidatus Sulfotelmatobacter kueseliae TaxID=2042962 RepID=A0A2U3KKH6_9BACT|nr:putative Non-specific protein-tyrosine kinase [Candidatus Sulfotelmatobacter kueseliae]